MRYPNVERANAVSIKKLAEDVPKELNGFTLAIYGGLEVPKGLRSQIWEIFDDNMKYLLESSGGPDRLEKEGEWFHPYSRLLILTKPPLSANANPSTSTARGSRKRPEQEIVAYGVFRFDTEENMDDGEDEVLYCYELQISSSAKRNGLGSKLVEIMEAFGSKHRMKKTMLTCFKNNEPALAFYKSLGFSNDPICPSQFSDSEDDGDDEEIDYFILSKPLAQVQSSQV